MSLPLSPRPLVSRLAAPRRPTAFLRPLTIALLAALGAIGIRVLEDRVASDVVWLTMDPSVARTFLASVSGTMITATIVVFWVRGLLVTTHAGRMPNRILSDYLADRYQLWVMGTMVGVFTFAVVGFISVSVGQAEGQPQISAGVTIGITAVASVVALLAIVQSISSGVRSMHEQRIMRKVMETAFRVIERDYPELSDEGADDEAPEPDPDAETIPATQIGWVRACDEDRLFASLPPGTTCWLDARIGDFVSPAASLCRVATDRPDDLDRAGIESAFTIGETRDNDNDLSLSLRNLVDIALGGLVEGADRTTAREAILHLGAVLRPVVVWEGPARTHHGDDGQMIVRYSEPDFAHHLHDVFQDLARAGADPVTARTLMKVVDQLREAAALAGRHDRVKVLERDADLIMQHVRDDGAGDRALQWVAGP